MKKMYEMILQKFKLLFFSNVYITNLLIDTQ